MVELDVEEIRTPNAQIVNDTTRDGQKVLVRNGIVFQNEDVIGSKHLMTTGIQTKDVILFLFVYHSVAGRLLLVLAVTLDYRVNASQVQCFLVQFGDMVDVANEDSDVAGAIIFR